MGSEMNRADEYEAVEFEAKLKEDENLVTGRLENGLKYWVLPCTKPANRVEAHLVVNVGSLDEDDEEQGLAHVVEHLVFCATEKLPNSEKVKTAMSAIGMSFGADVNASTDFRDTTYTFHGPIERPQNFPLLNGSEGIAEGFKGVLQILFEICFRATISEESVETEKAAVLSELQLRNTVEFRSDKSFIEKYHAGTRLPTRYPIGKEEIIKGFTMQDVQQFYEKYYTPENMELYCVGSFDSKEAVKVIDSVFSAQPPKETAYRQGLELESSHVYDSIDPSRKFAAFHHNLLTQTVVCFATKVERHPVRTFEDLRINLADSICGCVFDERMEYVYRNAEEPPFTDVGWSYDGSYREGCATNMISITCDPELLREAIFLTVKEVVKLYHFGILPGEYNRCLHMFLKALKQEAQQAETKQSSAIISDLIHETKLGDVFMSSATNYELFVKVSKTLNIELVNRRIKALFSGLGFGIAGDDVKEDPAGESFDPVGCGDHMIFVSGPPNPPVSLGDVESYVQSAMDAEIEEPTEIELPDYLFEVVPEAAPFVRVVGAGKKGLDVTDPKRPFEEESGAWFRSLENGARGAFHVTQNDLKHFSIRVNIQSWLAASASEADAAALSIGFAVLFSGGAAGLESHVLSKYNSSHNLDLEFALTLDCQRIEITAGTNDNGLRRAFELLYAFFNAPCWEHLAFEHAKRERLIALEESQRDIERKTAEVSLRNFFDGDKRVTTPSKRAIRGVNFANMKDLVSRTLLPSNLEVVVVGDFDPEEAERYFASYFGSAPFEENGISGTGDLKSSTREALEQVSVFDHEGRAVVALMSALPGRWSLSSSIIGGGKPDSDGNGVSPGPAFDISKLAFGSRCLVVLSEVLNNRLFKQVREEKKLAYWVQSSLTFLETQDLTPWVVRMSPLADKVDEAIAAVHEVLASISAGAIDEEEFNMALPPILTACESNLKQNSHWLSLCSNVTDLSCPKDATCLVNTREAYRSITLEDLKRYACPHLRNRTFQITVGVTRPYTTVEDFYPRAPKFIRDVTPGTLGLWAGSAVLLVCCTAAVAVRFARHRG